MATVQSRIMQAISGTLMPRPSMPDTPMLPAEPQRLYDVLRAYYHSNDLYGSVSAALYERGTWSPGMMPLRNPAHRVVEFYVPHLWPKADEIDCEDEALRDAILQVWRWSNWSSRSRMAARWFAMLGDLFLKVAARGGPDDPDSGGEDADAGDPGASAAPPQVFFQIIDPADVTDFAVDSRGYLTSITIETPQVRRIGGTITPYWAGEEWDKAAQEMRQWEADQRGAAGGERRNLTATPFAEFGIDFIPIVHAKFIDSGNLRGDAAFTHALDKIDEANRAATRLHQTLFRNNDATWALTAGVGADGRPLPPPAVRTTTEAGADGTRITDSSVVEIGGQLLWRLPGGATLQPLVPNIQYEDALKILESHMDELEADLPELGYYLLRQQEGEISGVALRLRMGPALSKAEEARENATAALQRADAMAITIGKALGLFADVEGDYQSGAFDHDFDRGEIIPLTTAEEAAVRGAEARAAIAEQEAGLSRRESMRRWGFTEDEIERMLTEAADDAEAAMERQARMFDAGRGGAPGAEQSGDEDDDQQAAQ